MSIRNHREGLWTRLGTSLLAMVLAVGLTGCSEILEVEDPDIITPGSLEGPVGLNTQFAGAVGDFIFAYSGGDAPGSFGDSFVSFDVLMSDQMFLSGTFPTRTEVDQRSVAIDNGTLLNVFGSMHRARVETRNAATLLQEAGESDRPAEMLALNGFMYLAFGEIFCSGVPFSEVPPEGDFTFGEQLTTAETFGVAVDRFNEALSLTGDADLQNLARIGLARAHLNLGNYSQAAQAVAGVPTSYMYLMFHSDNTARQENGLHEANADTRRQSISNEEGRGSISSGGQGLAYRMDPMAQVLLPWVEDPAGGFDSTSPQYNLLQYSFGIPLGPDRGTGRNAPAPLATGVEARLIEAEAAMNAGDMAGAVAILNQLRTANGVAAAPMPGSMAAATDLLFHDRAIWLYGTGHRVGDLRRLIRQYGRAADTVFPSGAYAKGGNYGTDVSLPVPEEELNNPNFVECLAPTSQA